MTPGLRISLDYLDQRRNAKVFHIMQEADGTLHDLDLDVRGATRDELVATMVATLQSLAPDAPLPAAPAEDWMAFAAAPYLYNFHIRNEAMFRGMSLVLVRGIAA